MAFLPHNTLLLFQNYQAWGGKSTIFDDAPELNRLLKLKCAQKCKIKSKPLQLIYWKLLGFLQNAIIMHIQVES